MAKVVLQFYPMITLKIKGREQIYLNICEISFELKSKCKKTNTTVSFFSWGIAGVVSNRIEAGGVSGPFPLIHAWFV